MAITALENYYEQLSQALDKRRALLSALKKNQKANFKYKATLVEINEVAIKQIKLTILELMARIETIESKENEQHEDNKTHRSV